MPPVNSAANLATRSPAPNVRGTPQNTGRLERGLVRLFAKYPAHNGFFCSYEVFIEAEVFKPDTGRSAMIYFSGPEMPLEHSYYDYGRFCFFLPKSVQPVFDSALNNKGLVLSVLIVTDDGRIAKDQSEAVFHLQTRDALK
ncbi:MAG: hypothetical protein LBR07_09815 [Puniceicoccales bacterium]|nr:hypothetical protein [Puniceicoccales bacterium]